MPLDGRGRIFTTGLTINGVAFSIQLIDFRIFGGKTVIFTVSKRTRMLVLQTESKVVSLNLKNGSIHENRK